MEIIIVKDILKGDISKYTGETKQQILYYKTIIENMLSDIKEKYSEQIYLKCLDKVSNTELYIDYFPEWSPSTVCHTVNMFRHCGNNINYFSACLKHELYHSINFNSYKIKSHREGEGYVESDRSNMIFVPDTYTQLNNKIIVDFCELYTEYFAHKNHCKDNDLTFTYMEDGNFFAEYGDSDNYSYMRPISDLLGIIIDDEETFNMFCNGPEDFVKYCVNIDKKYCDVMTENEKRVYGNQPFQMIMEKTINVYQKYCSANNTEKKNYEELYDCVDLLLRMYNKKIENYQKDDIEKMLKDIKSINILLPRDLENGVDNRYASKLNQIYDKARDLYKSRYKKELDINELDPLQKREETKSWDSIFKSENPVLSTIKSVYGEKKLLSIIYNRNTLDESDVQFINIIINSLEKNNNEDQLINLLYKRYLQELKQKLPIDTNNKELKTFHFKYVYDTISKLKDTNSNEYNDLVTYFNSSSSSFINFLKSYSNENDEFRKRIILSNVDKIASCNQKIKNKDLNDSRDEL